MAITPKQFHRTLLNYHEANEFQESTFQTHSQAQPGDVVAIFMENGVHFVAAWLACAKVDLRSFQRRCFFTKHLVLGRRLYWLDRLLLLFSSRHIFIDRCDLGLDQYESSCRISSTLLDQLKGIRSTLFSISSER